MNKLSRILKPFMPILAALYGFMMIYVTALPMAGENKTLGHEFLSWTLTLAAIALSYVLVYRGVPRVFPEAKQFSLKLPSLFVAVGLLLMTPLCFVVKNYIVFGLTSLIHPVQLEPITYTYGELREDLLASVHAVLLAPVLEELCYRQLAISPFRRRWMQVMVCVVMAFLFGILHVRNFLGAFLDAMLFGLVFIWMRNIWFAVLLHAGSNLTATLLAVYCMLNLGEIQMSKSPVILLPDTMVIVATMALAVIGLLMLKLKQKKHDDNRMRMESHSTVREMIKKKL